MNCPKCNQPVDAGASFCGNCGQPIQKSNPVPQSVTNNTSSIPAYATATKAQQNGEIRAIIGTICGVIGLVGAKPSPLIAFVFGIFGVVLGTLSRRGANRGLSLIGIVVSSLAITAGFGSWAYNLSHDPALQTKTSHKEPTTVISSANVATPCFEFGFATELRIKNDANSCDLQAYDGLSFDRSDDIYKIYANQIPNLSETRLESIAKSTLEKDIANMQKKLPDLTITSQGMSEFAGSPAYNIKAVDKNNSVAVIESAVLHKTRANYNLFVMFRGGAGEDISFDEIETQWQWK